MLPGWTPSTQIRENGPVSVSGRFRLLEGNPGPTQQSQVSCGAACLLVARMTIDPGLARWVVEGVRTGTALTAPTNSSRPQDRFADLERAIMRRTNAIGAYGGHLQAPWPRALGTPPWGALAELEHGAALPGTRYEIVPLRGLGEDRVRAAYDELQTRVRRGMPALLYVGSATMPRHIVLLFRDERGALLRYDPADGSVRRFEAAHLVTVRLSGWRHGWLMVQPHAQSPATRPVRAIRRQTPLTGLASEPV